jgi:ABC-type glycerol-3-phosphate transport system permease component
VDRHRDRGVPVYLAVQSARRMSPTIISNGQMPLTPGGHFFENYYRTIFIGTSGTTREPVYTMLLNSFVMAMVIACGKIFISILSAYAIVYFKFPLRMSAFWIIFITLMLPSRCASIRPTRSPPTSTCSTLTRVSRCRWSPPPPRHCCSGSSS